MTSQAAIAIADTLERAADEMYYAAVGGHGDWHGPLVEYRLRQGNSLFVHFGALKGTYVWILMRDGDARVVTRDDAVSLIAAGLDERHDDD